MLMSTVASGSSTTHPSWVGFLSCHTHSGAGRALRIALNASGRPGQVIDRRETVGRGHQSEHTWLGAQRASPAAQSPPNATAMARSSRIFAGSGSRGPSPQPHAGAQGRSSPIFGRSGPAQLTTGEIILATGHYRQATRHWVRFTVGVPFCRSLSSQTPVSLTDGHLPRIYELCRSITRERRRLDLGVSSPWSTRYPCG